MNPQNCPFPMFSRKMSALRRVLCLTFALVGIVAFAGFATAETGYFCQHPGERIEITAALDHGEGSNILFLRRAETDQVSIRLRRLARSGVSVSWREISDEGQFGDLVWMETDGTAVLVDRGSVVASQCRPETLATRARLETDLPLSTGRKWSEYMLPDDCYGRPRWLRGRFGWVQQNGEWVWRSVNESWGVFVVPTGVPVSEDFLRITSDLALGAEAVFAKGERRDDIDRGSFVWLEGQWYADKDHVYGGCGWPQVRREIDRDTFQPISVNYGSDRAGCFHVSGELRGCQADTFVPLGGDHARDAGMVWYRNVPIPDADPATFKTLSRSPGHGEDANHRFEFGRLVEEN